MFQPVLTVDHQANAAYLEVSAGPVIETREVAPGVLVDVDGHGAVVGVEVLDLGIDVPPRKRG